MLRRLLLTAFVLGLSFALAALLWSVIGSPVTAQADQGNCPDGFTWERLSGQCCVQDRETLPENGKIGYVGNSLCTESSGLIGIFEQRPTTDGKGPPGCPGYTSFPFLKACVTQEEYQRLQQTGGGAAAVGAGSEPGGGGEPSGGGDLTSGGGQGNRVESAIRDVSEALYDKGSGPSKRDLAATGGLAALLVTAVVGSAFLASPPVSPSTGGTSLDGPPIDVQPPDGPPIDVQPPDGPPIDVQPPDGPPIEPPPDTEAAAPDEIPPIELPPKTDEVAAAAAICERALEQAQQQRAQALVDWHAFEDLVDFYRWHYWTRELPRLGVLGGLGLAGGLSLGLTAEVTGPLLAPAVKYAAGALGVGAALRNSSWPPSPDEAEALLEKFKPLMNEARQRYFNLDRRCGELEGQLRGLRAGPH
jgi:hypothetical protein